MGDDLPPIDAPPEAPAGSCSTGLDKLADAVDTGLLTLHDALADGLYTVHVHTKELIKTHASVLSPSSGAASAGSGPSPLGGDEQPAPSVPHVPDLHLRVQVPSRGCFLALAWHVGRRVHPALRFRATLHRTGIALSPPLHGAGVLRRRSGVASEQNG